MSTQEEEPANPDPSKQNNSFLSQLSGESLLQEILHRLEGIREKDPKQFSMHLRHLAEILINSQKV